MINSYRLRLSPGDVDLILSGLHELRCSMEMGESDWDYDKQESNYTLSSEQDLEVMKLMAYLENIARTG